MSQVLFEKLDECVLCEEASFESLPFYYRHKYENLHGVKCRSCGLIFINPRLSKNALKDLYTKEYFKSDYHCGHTKVGYFSQDLPDSTSKSPILDSIDKYHSKSSNSENKGEFLEIGCAGSTFLKLAQYYDWNTCGLEISDDAAKFAREKLGLNVTAGILESYNSENSFFDVVFMGDVLEHLSNPFESLLKVNLLLKRGGLLAIASPSIINCFFSKLGIFVLKCTNRKNRMNILPYHLFEFTPQTITKLLEKSGFRILKLKNNAISPIRIPTRENFIINSLRFLIQLFNWLFTKATNSCGDRILVIAEKL